MEIDLSKLGVTPGNWESAELDKGKFLIAVDEVSLLSAHEEQDPLTGKYSPWGVFSNKQDAFLCSVAKEALIYLIRDMITREERGFKDSHAIEKKNLIKKAFPGFTWEEIKKLAVKN